MSLHVQSTTEADHRLAKQRTRQALSSILLSLSLIIVILLALAFFVLPTLTKVTPEFAVSYTEPSLIDEPIDNPKVKLPSKPTPASSSSAPSQKLIVAQSVSSFSIPTMDVPNDAVTVAFGSGRDDFGNGWAGNGDGNGTGNGGGSFGSTRRINSALQGNLYDFKQNEKGEERKFDTSEAGPYAREARSIQRSHFRDSAFRDYYKAPQDLYLTHLAIPLSDAATGPKYFNAEKEVQPKGWIANYKGAITAPTTGTFRFVGMGDDYLSVTINGQERLFGCWPSLQNAVRGSWKPSEEFPSHHSPYGPALIYGDWIRVKKGERLEINLAVGERPGGKVGFVLLIQDKAQQYETDSATGRPILPLFTTALIEEKRQSEIVRDFGNFRFDWENMPIWGSP